MVTHNSIYFGLCLVIFVGVSVAIILSGNQTQTQVDKFGDITNFEDCAKAKFPVVESYPRRCSLPDHRVFTETVSMQECKIQEDCPTGFMCKNHICSQSKAGN